MHTLIKMSLKIVYTRLLLAEHPCYYIHNRERKLIFDKIRGCLVQWLRFWLLSQEVQGPKLGEIVTDEIFKRAILILIPFSEQTAHGLS